MIKSNDFIKMKVSIFFFSNKAMQSEDLMNLECLDFNCLHKWIVMIQKKLNEITAVDHYAYNHQIHITLE